MKTLLTILIAVVLLLLSGGCSSRAAVDSDNQTTKTPRDIKPTQLESEPDFTSNESPFLSPITTPPASIPPVFISAPSSVPVTTGAVVPATPADFNFIFKFGVGAKNELDTFKGIFIKDMILDPPITTNLKVTQQEMDTIYQKMVEMDFVNYPDVFKVIVPPGSITGMVTPNDTYYFRVSYRSRIKEIFWNDVITNENAEATNLRSLCRLIQDIIRSKAEYKNLPPARGGYL
jgi:hypothetical protein